MLGYAPLTQPTRRVQGIVRRALRTEHLDPVPAVLFRGVQGPVSLFYDLVLMLHRLAPDRDAEAYRRLCLGLYCLPYPLGRYDRVRKPGLVEEHQKLLSAVAYREVRLP